MVEEVGRMTRTHTPPRRRPPGLRLVVAATSLLVLTCLVGERTIVAWAVAGGPGAAAWLALLLYAGGIAALVAVHRAAMRLREARRVVAAWLITASTVVTAAFGLLALLDLAFWASARQAEAAEVWGVGALLFAAATAPSLASLLAGILLFVSDGPADGRSVSRSARPTQR
jgi:hypothetical protein